MRQIKGIILFITVRVIQIYSSNLIPKLPIQAIRKSESVVDTFSVTARGPCSYFADSYQYFYGLWSFFCPYDLESSHNPDTALQLCQH